MGFEYKKYVINMKNCSNEFQLWNEEINLYCRIETYKEKASILIEGKYMMPSTRLVYNYDMEYEIVLIGISELGLLHKSVGILSVDKKGEGTLYTVLKKNNISGKNDCIDEYNYIMILASPRDSEKDEVITISKGELFPKEIEKNSYEELWHEGKEIKAFSNSVDETKARWRIIDRYVDNVGLEEYKNNIMRYEHFLIGRSEKKEEMEWFIAIPGRFLIKEQPDEGNDPFSLWQPLAGGEKYFYKFEGEELYGYWISLVDKKTGKLIEA